ncbi:hypothetical protein RJ639_008820 [Escallonia herrerae]|uniref:beta-galactosidase n=1 Tax=Escallonia herrerae TaxID=1293975 RepID=A0AA89ARY3_9ASTE|nr:hypothetical protein RJ639_008820 [Escallonia herrerae]
MPKPRSYNRTREAWQVDNFFSHLERYFEALDIDEEKVQWTVTNQVELIFNRLDDLEVDSRLTVLERKVDVFAKELDDLIKERVAHFTKWEVQRHKDLKGQVMELQEELGARKKDLIRVTRQGCIAVQPRGKKMPEPRSYNGTREARQLDNRFWHLERYFEVLNIDDEKENVQTLVMYLNDRAALRWRRRYTDGCDIKTWEKFKRELQRQFYLDSVNDKPWMTEAEGSIRESKSGSPKATDDERNEDEGRRRHHKGEKKHGGSLKQGESHDYKAHGGPRRGCFYGAGPHCGRYCQHKGVIKNVDLRICRWTGKKDFNIIDMDEFGVVLGMDFMEKSSTTLNPYCGVMIMAGKEGQPEWMIPLVSKDGANARKGITLLQLDEGLTLCYVEWQMGPRTYTVDMLTKTITTEKFVRWGGRKPRRPAEDLALSVALFFQSGGIFMNYYMYHGGTNFGRTAGGPYIATSYEYDAPLDESGNLNQPKWGHLKQLHAAIKSVEKILTNSTSATKEFGNANLTTYTNAATGERVCFLSNLNTTQDANIDLQKDGKCFVPAWSVSILKGCNKEIYNSAKISTQETVMVKKPDGAENQLAKLSWQWTAEPLEDRLDGRGDFTEPKLLEQTATTLDASDYLWYMTSVNITDKAWTNAILRVNTTGHVLHAYVNGKLVGTLFYFQSLIAT